MASYFGTDTGFSSITDNYLYLEVEDTDKIYNTDVTIAELKQRGYPEQLFEDNRILTDISQNKQSCLKNLKNSIIPTPNSSFEVTVYDLLSLYPELSECKKLVDSSSYKDELTKDRYTTFFAYTNQNSDVASLWLKRFNTVSPGKTTTGYQRELLKAHTASFTLDPVMLKGRLNDVFTRSEGNDIRIDGRYNPMYLYTNSKEFNGFSYNPPLLKINIIGFLACDNGVMYVIDRPIYPEIII